MDPVSDYRKHTYLFLRKESKEGGINLSFEALTDSIPSMCGETEFYGPFLIFDINSIPSVGKNIDSGVYDPVIIHTKLSFRNTEKDPFIGQTLGSIRRKYNVVLRQIIIPKPMTVNLNL